MDNEELILAIRNNNIEEAKKLLSLDSVREYVHTRGNLTLRSAAHQGQLEIVNLLLRIDKIRNKANVFDNEALLCAAENGHFEVVKALLKLDEVREYADARNNCVLRWAARHGNVEVVKWLLELDVVRSQAEDLNNQALQWAAEHGHAEIVKILLSLDNVRLALTTERPIYPSNANAPLLLAAKNGHVEVVKQLLSIDNIRNIAHVNSNKVLRVAAKNGHAEIVKLLLNLNKVRDHANQKDNAALKEAASKGHVEIVDLLLRVKVVTSSLDENIVSDLLNEKVLSNLGLVNLIMHVVGKPSLPDYYENIQPSWVECVQHLSKTSSQQDNPYSIAKSILDTHKEYTHLRQLDAQDFNALIGNQESSMDDELLKKANTHFTKNIRPALEKKFQALGDNFLARLTSIELKIQQLILKQIKQVAESEHDQDIIQFIEANQDNIFQNELLMAKARQMFNSSTIISHIAWRCYDRHAPNREWSNLFVTPIAEGANTPIFSTRWASDKPLTLQEASDIVRERAAYYYLLIENEPNLEQKQAMEIDLTFYLAAIKRAHNIDEIGTDSPSCFPGTLTRLACIASKSSLLECPLEKQVILQEFLLEQIEQAFEQILNQKERLNAFKPLFPEADSSQALCAEISDAITGINHSNALDILINDAKTNLGYSIDVYTPAHAKARQIFRNIIIKPSNSEDVLQSLIVDIEKKLQKINQNWFVTPIDRAYILFFLTSLSQPAVSERLAALYSQAFYNVRKTQKSDKNISIFETEISYIRRQILVNPLSKNNVQLLAQCKKLEEKQVLFNQIKNMQLIKSYSEKEIEKTVEELSAIPFDLRVQVLSIWNAKKLEKKQSSLNFFSNGSTADLCDIQSVVADVSTDEMKSLSPYLMAIKSCELLLDNSEQIINLVKSLNPMALTL